MSSEQSPKASLAPKLDSLEDQLDTTRDEICDLPHVAQLNTGELIRVEETLAIAAEAAKEVVSIRRRIRVDSQGPIRHP